MTYKLGEVEMQFVEIIWANEPLTSRALTVLAEEQLNWNRSTTYTILRKLCEKGILENNKAVVSTRISKEEYNGIQSEKFVAEQFSGSLPRFLAAFARRKQLSEKEIGEIEAIIQAHKEG